MTGRTQDQVDEMGIIDDETELRRRNLKIIIGRIERTYPAGMRAEAIQALHERLWALEKEEMSNDLQTEPEI